jgi:hypothetical protein
VQVDDASVDEVLSHRSRVGAILLGLLSAAAVVLLLQGVPGGLTPMPVPSDPAMMLARPMQGYPAQVTNVANVMQGGTGMQWLSLHGGFRRPAAHPAFATGGQYAQPGKHYRAQQVSDWNARSVATQKHLEKEMKQGPVPKVPDMPLSTVLETQLLELIDTSKYDEHVDAPRIGRYINRLEEFYPPSAAGTYSLDGTWRLVYASRNRTPFFRAFSKVIQEAAAPFLALCDNPPQFRIGAVWQTLQNTASTDGQGSLVSSIEFEISDADTQSEYYRPPVRGVVKTIAHTQRDAFDPVSLILEQQVTEFQDSAVPLTDFTIFPIESALDDKAEHSETSHLTTIYLSPSMRVSRTHEGDALVYVRTSD